MSFIYMVNLPPPNEDALKIGKTVNVERRIHQLSQQLINVEGYYTLYFSVKIGKSVSRVETRFLDYLKSKYQLFNPYKSHETFIHTDSEVMKADAKRQLLLLVEDDKSTLFPNLCVPQNNGSGVNSMNSKKSESILKWLKDDEGKLWTNGYIAKKCDVHIDTVSKIANSLSYADPTYVRPTRLKYINKHGSVGYIETSKLKMKRALINGRAL